MPTPKQIERHNRMMSAALGEFCRLGFHAANVDQIAQKAQVGKGTLYRHFESKEGLFLAVFQHVLERLEKGIKAKADFSNFQEGTRIAIRTYLDLIRENPDIFHFFRIFAADEHVPEARLREKLAEKYFSSAMWAIEEIKMAQKRGQMRRDLDPERFAYALLGMINFLVYYWMRYQKPEDLVSNADMITDILFRGITIIKP